MMIQATKFLALTLIPMIIATTPRLHLIYGQDKEETLKEGKYLSCDLNTRYVAGEIFGCFDFTFDISKQEKKIYKLRFWAPLSKSLDIIDSKIDFKRVFTLNFDVVPRYHLNQMKKKYPGSSICLGNGEDMFIELDLAQMPKNISNIVVVSLYFKSNKILKYDNGLFYEFSINIERYFKNYEINGQEIIIHSNPLLNYDFIFSATAAFEGCHVISVPDGFRIASIKEVYEMSPISHKYLKFRFKPLENIVNQISFSYDSFRAIQISIPLSLEEIDSRIDDPSEIIFLIDCKTNNNIRDAVCHFISGICDRNIRINIFFSSTKWLLQRNLFVKTTNFDCNEEVITISEIKSLLNDVNEELTNDNDHYVILSEYITYLDTLSGNFDQKMDNKRHICIITDNNCSEKLLKMNATLHFVGIGQYSLNSLNKCKNFGQGICEYTETYESIGLILLDILLFMNQAKAEIAIEGFKIQNIDVVDNNENNAQALIPINPICIDTDVLDKFKLVEQIKNGFFRSSTKNAVVILSRKKETMKNGYISLYVLGKHIPEALKISINGNSFILKTKRYPDNDEFKIKFAQYQLSKTIDNIFDDLLGEYKQKLNLKDFFEGKKWYDLLEYISLDSENKQGKISMEIAELSLQKENEFSKKDYFIKFIDVYMQKLRFATIHKLLIQDTFFVIGEEKLLYSNNLKIFDEKRLVNYLLTGGDAMETFLDEEEAHTFEKCIFPIVTKGLVDMGVSDFNYSELKCRCEKSPVNLVCSQNFMEILELVDSNCDYDTMLNELISTIHILPMNLEKMYNIFVKGRSYTKHSITLAKNYVLVSIFNKLMKLDDWRNEFIIASRKRKIQKEVQEEFLL